ncbi:hypothetical protein [Brevundimonas nasdae]|uniref:Uncharacterized protein n=1 Tax=Brevundimonas nasdae TaxID=172043 RepID=A0ABX8TGQ8_9CAUL|nr:hypothetical protein [Brevundimonas nasdae]QYC09287.1 hypothetical protein KWG56_11785 [Brevundimonas nasdae]QYC15336.1 hypothetical protein KWG63_07115 [Brevundimonas nasdae]
MGQIVAKRGEITADADPKMPTSISAYPPFAFAMRARRAGARRVMRPGSVLPVISWAAAA